MNIFMESCISCFFFFDSYEMQVTGHKCRLEYRSPCYGKMNNTKPVFYNVALITMRNKILALGVTAYLSYLLIEQ